MHVAADGDAGERPRVVVQSDAGRGGKAALLAGRDGDYPRHGFAIDGVRVGNALKCVAICRKYINTCTVETGLERQSESSCKIGGSICYKLPQQHFDQLALKQRVASDCRAIS